MKIKDLKKELFASVVIRFSDKQTMRMTRGLLLQILAKRDEDMEIDCDLKGMTLYVRGI